MTPMTSTDHLDRGDGNRSISPIAMQEETRLLMGVDDDSEVKRRRVRLRERLLSSQMGRTSFRELRG